MKLKGFLESTCYLNFLDELDGFLPEKIDRTSKVYILISNVLDTWLDVASVSVSDLEWIIANEKVILIQYILEKQRVYTEPNGGGDNIVNEKPNRSFPISHMIEYHFLLIKPSELPAYLKKIRIPDATRYASEITNIFNSAKG